MSSASGALSIGVIRGPYPERDNERAQGLDQFGERLVAPLTRRLAERRCRAQGLVEKVDRFADEIERLSDEELALEATSIGARIAREGFDQEPVSRCFAVVREAARRHLGLFHYGVQLEAGWTMLAGAVAEMQTGEGKTLAATLPACTAALAGVPVHVITSNDYLAERDAEIMEPVYRALGLSIGIIIGGLSPDERRQAYSADITYATSKEVAFDYLKDHIALGGNKTRLRLEMMELARGRSPRERLIHRGLHFAIVDEADSVLIDEARTPLIIAGAGENEIEESVYRKSIELARELEEERDFTLNASEGSITLSDTGKIRLQGRGETMGGLLRGDRRRQALVRQALSALHLFKRDIHYLVRDDSVQIIDEYSGRVMPDRSWEQGLHQMIEIKEDVTVTARQDTLARISYQRFFGRYLKLGGMTGTAKEVEAELWSTYGLGVVPIATNLPCLRERYETKVFHTSDQRWEAVVERIAELNATGRPVLVGTGSVASSEQLSERLDARGLEHTVLNARQDADEAEVVATAGERSRITVATNMAGRGTDIALGRDVADLGGLHVLATEHHSAARIDRQLEGRAGRQGDRGSSESMVSFEDELMLKHGTKLSLIIRQLRMHPGTGLGDTLGRLAMRIAQKNAERLHARTRRDLLEADEKLESLLAFSGRGE